MQTLSLFPDLLTFSLIGPFLIRIAAAGFMFYLGWNRFYGRTVWISMLSALSGIFLLVGLYTQAVAIVSIIIVSSDWVMENGNKNFSGEKKMLYWIVKMILLSLLVTGPGFLAFDLPL